MYLSQCVNIKSPSVYIIRCSIKTWMKKRFLLMVLLPIYRYRKSLSLNGGDFLCQCTIGNLAWFIKVETNEDYFSKECATNVSYRSFIQWFHAISFLRWYVEMIKEITLMGFLNSLIVITIFIFQIRIRSKYTIMSTYSILDINQMYFTQ